MQPAYVLEQVSYIVELLRQRRLSDLQHTLHATLKIADRLFEVNCKRLESNCVELTVDGVTHILYAAQGDNKLFVHFAGRHWQLDIVDSFGADDNDAGANSGRVRAPMPGVVIEQSVRLGDHVEAGQCLMLVESMKLQAEIKSPLAGVVSELNFTVSESFNKGDTLIDIVPNDRSTELDAVE